MRLQNRPGIARFIRDGLYGLDDKYILVKNPNESYVVIGTDTANMSLLTNMPEDGIPVLERMMVD